MEVLPSNTNLPEQNNPEPISMESNGQVVPDLVLDTPSLNDIGNFDSVPLSAVSVTNQ